jgi:hypothetical protein
MSTTPYLQPYKFEGLGLAMADVAVLGELPQTRIQGAYLRPWSNCQNRVMR